MTKEAYSSLLNSIADILIENGIKATSMDLIATSLHISKRTLYEIFDSKTSMVTEALIAFHRRMCEEHAKIFSSSDNVLEAILLGFHRQRDFLSRVNVNFFRDRDSLFAEARCMSAQSKQNFIDNIVELLERGVKEGLFRDDVNMKVQCRLMLIQMESLKRMEELFPPDISLLNAYDSVSIGFLRSIASIRGLEILDNLIKKLSAKTIA